MENNSVVKKIVTIVVCGLTFLVFSIVHSKCVEGDCKNGRGVLVHKDGRRYVGEFEGGAIQGQGVLSYPDGIQYSGEFQRGRYNG